VRSALIPITAVTLLVMGATSYMSSQEVRNKGVDAEKLRSEIKRLQEQIHALRWSSDAPESWKQSLAIEKSFRKIAAHGVDECLSYRNAAITRPGSGELNHFPDVWFRSRGNSTDM
jgi:hypothetical protein